MIENIFIQRQQQQQQNIIDLSNTKYVIIFLMIMIGEEQYFWEWFNIGMSRTVIGLDIYMYILKYKKQLNISLYKSKKKYLVPMGLQYTATGWLFCYIDTFIPNISSDIGAKYLST